MRRRKADVLHMLAHLLLFSNDAQLRRDTLTLLIGQWDDFDSAVRATAIAMIQVRSCVLHELSAARQHLGASGLPEMQQLVVGAPQQPESTSGNESAKESSDVPAPSTLMQAIVQRIRDPDYA